MNIIRLAAILGFFGVLFGAFGAHALRGRVSEGMIEVWRTGVLYHLVHTLALLGVAALGPRLSRPRLVAGFFTAGIVIFAGSLYILVLSERSFWGAITPIGGLSFMLGWIALLVCARPDRAA